MHTLIKTCALAMQTAFYDIMRNQHLLCSYVVLGTLFNLYMALFSYFESRAC